MSHVARRACPSFDDHSEEDGMSTMTDTNTRTSTSTSTSHARVPLEHDGLLARVLKAYSRRQFGVEAEPMLALLHQRKVLTGITRFGMGAQKWSTLDTGLKEL